MRSADGMLGMSFTPNIYSVMNKAIQTLAALLLVSGSIFGQSVRINAPSSSIRWDGGNALGKMHNGNIAVTSGELEFQSGALVGGSFTIDMNSMTNADLPETVGANLMGHLKSADFFDVEKFPTAKLEIKSATPFQGGKSTVNAEAATRRRPLRIATGLKRGNHSSRTMQRRWSPSMGSQPFLLGQVIGIPARSRRP